MNSLMEYRLVYTPWQGLHINALLASYMHPKYACIVHILAADGTHIFGLPFICRREHVPLEGTGCEVWRTEPQVTFYVPSVFASNSSQRAGSEGAIMLSLLTRLQQHFFTMWLVHNFTALVWL